MKEYWAGLQESKRRRTGCSTTTSATAQVQVPSDPCKHSGQTLRQLIEKKQALPKAQVLLGLMTLCWTVWNWLIR